MIDHAPPPAPADLNLDQWIKAQRARAAMTTRVAFAQGWLLGAFSVALVVLVASALTGVAGVVMVTLAAGLGALTYSRGWGARPLDWGKLGALLRRRVW